VQTFLQSSFLQALAYALISSIWQMGLLWIGAILLTRMFKFSSAQTFNIAFTAQLSGFVFFTYTLLNAYQNNLTVNAAGLVSASSVYGYINLVMPYIAIVYLALLVYKTVKLFFIYRFTQKLRKHDLQKISAVSRMFVEDISALFSLRKKVSIYLSGKINCPLTIGFFKPVILIPVAAVNYLSTEQMEAVILHELAHIKRADYLLFLLQAVIDKVFFFNIFSKMLGDIIERERENACDDWVLQFKYNSMHYAEALLKLAKLQAASSFAMAASGKKKSVLLIRIKRLMRRPDMKIEPNFNSILFSLFALIIALGGMASFTLKDPVKLSYIKTRQQPVISNEKTNSEVTISGIIPAAKRSMENSKEKIAESTMPVTAQARVEKKLQQHETHIESAPETEAIQTINIDPAYLISTNKRIDSLTQALPQVNAALNTQVVITPELYKQALSYQNFKELENMLALTGDSVKVTESKLSKDSYRKLIAVETTDKNGDKHVYKLVVELYQ